LIEKKKTNRKALQDELRGQIELSLIKKGLTIVGVDEVGRGCLAGPVFAACASLDYEKLFSLPNEKRALIRDSKTLSAKQRATILPFLTDICTSYAIEMAEVQEIEQFGILNATFIAMHRSLKRCQLSFDVLLTDGNRPIPDYKGTQRPIIKGDNLCYAIAAASIFAKQKRDLYMKQQATIYPNYGFESHVGYGTAKHISAIKTQGICPLHRRNFAPVSNYIAT
jgi:ribonuclease HII